MRRHGDIGIWKNIVDPNLCENLIEFFDSEWVMAKLRDEDRCEDSYKFLYDEPLRKQYSKYLRDCGDEYFAFYGHDTWRKQSMPITMKVQKTKPGQKGFQGIHWEQGQGLENACRYAAWMTYLNDIDPDEGGKTVFPLQGMSLTPSRGTTVIWPAAYTHPHHAYPALAGETPKYIITGWLEYQPTTNEERRQ